MNRPTVIAVLLSSLAFSYSGLSLQARAMEQPTLVSQPSGCVRPAAAPYRVTRHASDSDELSATKRQAADEALRRAERRTGNVSSARAVTVVDVFVHVLRTETRGRVHRTRIQRQTKILNGAYAGRQSRFAASAPFRFRLAHVDVTVNARWYRMDEGSLAESRAKRALHRGNAADLNIYIGANRTGVLGWSTQPGEYRARPKMDGVVIARHTMAGGGGGHYSAGDSLVHESGHWFGLFHTFAGRCSARGDFVADTPAEARPNYTCPVRRDTCTAPGNDPVHNFMDYSYDACLSRFSRGQSRRMVGNWEAFRLLPASRS